MQTTPSASGDSNEPNSFENQVGTQCAGAGSTMCSLWLTGAVDELSIYDGLLSAARVQVHYAAALGI